MMGAVLMAVVTAAMVLTLVRLVTGPSLPDRVVALDLLGTSAMALVAVAAMVWDAAVLLDVAVAVAVISFVGTVAFARFLEGGGRG